jgi:hypothetical protein
VSKLNSAFSVELLVDSYEKGFCRKIIEGDSHGVYFL